MHGRATMLAVPTPPGPFAVPAILAVPFLAAAPRPTAGLVRLVRAVSTACVPGIAASPPLAVTALPWSAVAPSAPVPPVATPPAAAPLNAAPLIAAPLDPAPLDPAPPAAGRAWLGRSPLTKEPGPPWGRQRPGDPVRFTRQVRRRVPADRKEHSA